MRLIAAALATAFALSACATSAQPAPSPPSGRPTAEAPTTARLAYRAEQPLVILVSLDGFRADYLQRGVTPALSALAADGVRATAMRPSFPSITFPNHYTLVTGLRPDHHGIVDNRMEDPSITPDSVFTLGDFAAVSDRRWWDEAEPIWTTAERQGVRAGLMFWPGSEAPIGGVRPSLWAHFDGSLSPAHRVDHLLDWLDLPPGKRPGFLTLYFEAVDSAGHHHGPDSPEVTQALQLVDSAIARLVDGLKARGLYDRAEIVIVADHGMAATPPDQHLYLDDWAPADQLHVVSTGANAGVRPLTRAAEAGLLAHHAHADCRRKADLPPALHFGTNRRIPPVVCVGEVGWLLDTHAAEAKRRARPDAEALLGEHGYDPRAPEMAALFIAHGPAFRTGYVQPAFDNVDVYPLLAHLLGVQPRRNDGALAPVQGMLRPQ